MYNLWHPSTSLIYILGSFGNKCKIFPKTTSAKFSHTMVAGSNLSWQGIKRKTVYTEGAGPVCKCMGQCTLKGSIQGEG